MEQADATGSPEIEDSRLSVFRAESKRAAVRPPGKRRDRRVARFPGENFRSVLGADQQHETVRIADRYDLLARVTGDLHGARRVGREHAWRLAHRPVLRVERPQDEL